MTGLCCRDCNADAIIYAPVETPCGTVWLCEPCHERAEWERTGWYW